MMNRRTSSVGGRPRSLLSKALLLVLAVYSLSLLYFLRHKPDPAAGHCPPHQEGCGGPPGNPTISLKLWPPLPSFLPWVPPPNPAPRSCEAYFGNGFSHRVDLLPRRELAPGGGGWFRCFHSETLASSVCEGGNLRMDPMRIRMSRGGERLEEVMGRTEEEELPRFEPGSFQIEAGSGGGGEAGGKLAGEEVLDRIVPRGGIQLHTMRDLMSSVRVVAPGELQCTHWIDEPTLLVTRFEYANVFHTVTDWYSAYVSSRVTNLPNRPHLIFVDGHCKVSDLILHPCTGFSK
uniref:Beta-(1,2)-xylosyltransferase n=1 Tax=Anthurium amnicola TaxID=1678845 RepID=A0A1D1Y418_9ARAE